MLVLVVAVLPHIFSGIRYQYLLFLPLGMGMVMVCGACLVLGGSVSDDALFFILGFSAVVHLILLGAISFVGRQRTFWVLVTVFAVLLLLDIGGCSIVGSSLKHCW